MKFSQGYAWLGSIRSVPIRVHWTTPVGMVLISGFAFLPGAWAAFLLLVVCHELGHAFIVQACRCEVVAVDVNGLGGLCHWEGTATPLERAAIAWGGVVGQLVVLAAALPLRWFVAPHVDSVYAPQFFYALISSNLDLMAINLVPVRPLDGAEAWPLFGMLWRRWREASRRRRAAAERERAAAERRAAAAATSSALEHLDTLEDDAPPPMPREVEAVLDRILDETRREGQARRLKNRS
jgi:membrane-associated protease RseP (regulator of RpoE activity)